MRSYQIEDEAILKLSLGEYGRQRTSKKFHDLVLSLRSQNSRVPEIIVLQAHFSRRKVSIEMNLIVYIFDFSTSLRLFYVNAICPYSKKLIQKVFLNRFFLFPPLCIVDKMKLV